MTPEKTKNGWRIRLYLGKDEAGKKHWKVFSHRYKAQCERLVDEYKLLNPKPTKSMSTVEDAITNFLQKKKDKLSPSTYKAYCSYQKNAYKELNHYKIFNLTTDIIQDWVDNYQKDHSPKTTKNAFSLLQSSVHKLNRNLDFSDVELPAQKSVEYHLPTHEQIKELLELADSDLKLAIMLSAFSSLRRGEICGLRFKDLQGNVLHVAHSLVLNTDKEWVLKEPKTKKSNRYIPLPQSTVNMINSRFDGNPDAFILDINPNILSDRFRKLTKTVGISNTRFHDMRHFCATLLHSMSIPDSYIRKIGGWSNDGVMKNVYQNTLPDYEKVFSEKANSFVDTLVDTDGQL